MIICACEPVISCIILAHLLFTSKFYNNITYAGIEIPIDYASGSHKGFAFLEFVDGEDAAEAIYNMDGAELFGKTLTVNIAQADKMNLGSNKAVWSTEEWFKEQSGMKEDEERREQEKKQEIDAKLLKEKSLVSGI